MTFDLTAMRMAKEGATDGPWACHFSDESTTCNCRYILAEYGGMGSIATIDVCAEMKGPWGDDIGPSEGVSKANAALIAMAPDMADEIERLTAALATARKLETDAAERVLAEVLSIMDAGDEIVKPDYPDWFINRYETLRALTQEKTKEDVLDGHHWTLIEDDSDFNPATMANNAIYMGKRKYVAEDTIPAMLAAAREEGARMMQGAAARAVLHDSDKPTDNCVVVDGRPHVSEETAYRAIRALDPKEVTK